MCAAGRKSFDYNFKYEALNELKINNFNLIVFDHLNINSIRNKIWGTEVCNKRQILLVSETKIDNSFPTCHINGYSKPYRYDRNSFGGGLIAYFRHDIPCRELKCHKIPGNIEGSFFEINIRKRKWLLFFGYNHNKGNITNYLQNVVCTMDKYLESYYNILVIGDFNSEIIENPMKNVCEKHIILKV